MRGSVTSRPALNSECGSGIGPIVSRSSAGATSTNFGNNVHGYRNSVGERAMGP
jgi:hypothetical protein